MTNESVTDQAVTPIAEPAPRGKSTIEFPYLDLDNAVEIVKAVFSVEGDRCEWNQLATKLDVAAEGGGFRMRMITAKTFQLLTYEKGQVTLTELGIRVADPAHEKKARFDSFMSVPLFKQLFDRMNGQPLPPVAAVERMIETLGVAPKQKDKARQVFQRSAKQAGLFELATDRLSIPPGLNVGSREKTPVDLDRNKNKGSGGAGGGGSDGVSLDLDPLLIALLQKIPAQGEKWPQDRRLRWFRTFAMNVSQVYDEDDSPVELDIKPLADSSTGGGS